MIVKRPTRRKSKVANSRIVGVDFSGNHMENSMPGNDMSGSRFDSLGTNNDDIMQDNVNQDSAIVPVHSNQTTQHVTIGVRNPNAGKNTQGGTRGKENRNDNGGQKQTHSTEVHPERGDGPKRCGAQSVS